MKPTLLALILSGITIPTLQASPKVGQICHPDPEYVKYNYAGLWEKDSDGKLFCHYQQFMPESEASAALRERPEDTEIEADDDENDEQNEANDEDTEDYNEGDADVEEQ